MCTRGRQRRAEGEEASRARWEQQEAAKGRGRRFLIDQSIALHLFEQLVKVNTENQANDKLASALKRVDFAGFLVPTWLLLSGSFDDLYCLKLSWTRGQLKAAEDLEIDTIGKLQAGAANLFGACERAEL